MPEQSSFHPYQKKQELFLGQKSFTISLCILISPFCTCLYVACCNNPTQSMWAKTPKKKCSVRAIGQSSEEPWSKTTNDQIHSVANNDLQVVSNKTYNGHKLALDRTLWLKGTWQIEELNRLSWHGNLKDNLKWQKTATDAKWQEGATLGAAKALMWNDSWMGWQSHFTLTMQREDRMEKWPTPWCEQTRTTYLVAIRACNNRDDQGMVNWVPKSQNGGTRLVLLFELEGFLRRLKRIS